MLGEEALHIVKQNDKRTEPQLMRIMVARLSGTKSRASFLPSMSFEYCQGKALTIRDKQSYCDNAVILNQTTNFQQEVDGGQMYSVGCKTVFGGKVSKLTKLKSVQNQSQFDFDDIPFLCLSGRSNRYDILTLRRQRAEDE
jgi:hypothetical protein